MNERIKELAEQSWPDLPLHWWDRHDGEVAICVSKFAGLIISDVCSKLDPVLAKEILELYGVK